MYIPDVFAEAEPAVLHDLIRQFSFATFVTAVDGAPFASHLPLSLNLNDSGGRLLGHVARANPHWQAFDGKTTAMAVFQGPHAYVSPNWYVSTNLVPTWNYAAVHVYGRPRIIDDAEQTLAVLDQLVDENEIPGTGNWHLDHLDRKLVEGLRKGKFKMSQNRKPEDAAAAAAGLAATNNPVAHEVSEMMKAFLQGH
jgi:transcriptional regulator